MKFAARALLIVTAFAVGAVAQAFVINDDFETLYDGWTDTGNYTRLTASNGSGHNSARALTVTGRTAPEDGAVSNKGLYLEGGVEYTYRVYVRHAGRASETFNLTLSWTEANGRQGSQVIARETVLPNTWTALAATHMTPRGAFNQTFTITTNSTIDFQFDNFTASGFGGMGLARIANAPPPEEAGLKDVFARHFRVGNILNGGTINNANIRNLILREYNSISMENEMKPDATMRQSGSTDNNIVAQLNTGAVAILNFAAQNNIPVRGHVLVWHGQTPHWFFTRDLRNPATPTQTNSVNWATQAQMESRMESYINNILGLIKDQYPTLNLYAYDVVNEAVGFCGNRGAGPRCGGYDMRGAGGVGESNAGDSPWVQIYGDNSFIRSAFEKAYAARNRLWPNMKLFYNDYNEWDPPKRDHIINHILIPLRDAGLLDGMGMQGHIDANVGGWSSVERCTTAMNMYANLGIEVQITELDIGMDGFTLQQQADRYRGVFQHAMRINERNAAAGRAGRFTAIIIWGPNDGNSWRNDNPTLHDRSLNPKPAYDAVRSLVPQAQWGDGRNPPCCTGGDAGTGPVVIEPDPITGYFFHHTFEDGTVEGWRGRGDAAVANTAAQRANGARSLAVIGRTATWHGTELSLNTNPFVPGGRYSFSAIAMYNQGPETAEFALTMSYTLRDTTRFSRVATVAEAKRSHWVMLSNENFEIPAGASNLLLYVEMPGDANADLNFFVDDVMGGKAGVVAPGAGGVTNINPDDRGYLFHHTFEDGTVEGWGGRFGAAQVSNTDAASANGERSLFVTSRAGDWAGPAISLESNVFVPGIEYSFSVLAMFEDDDEEEGTFKFTLQYVLDGETHYDQLDLVTAKRGDWVILENPNFLIPDGAANFQLYVEMPGNETANFYIDDVMGGEAGAEAPGREGVTTSVRGASVARIAARPMVSLRGKTLNISTPTNAELRVRVIDARGRVRADFRTSGTSSRETFSLRRMPAGRYFVEVRGAGVRQVTPIVIR